MTDEWVIAVVENDRHVPYGRATDAHLLGVWDDILPAAEAVRTFLSDYPDGRVFTYSWGATELLRLTGVHGFESDCFLAMNYGRWQHSKHAEPLLEALHTIYITSVAVRAVTESEQDGEPSAAK